ncbi:Uncharacterised protein [Mycolicibacterium vanbaalenii]|uniref:Transmembrane protein n=1 Tax=Mycolicibacterium vanbaalenii TaxID=110539 RepID=A0A5S9PY27_MYCVN|nr:hypothetical protein [Mycolicibacterium vanbaalenii]CAA0109981.1 Uncharacterised protein [Mycolicibacterium vanbaalenii]
MTEPPETRPAGSSPTRPPDVDTGFWLWVVALPLMVTGYVVDMFTASERLPGPVVAFSLVILFVITVVVATFLVLMRQGYRWVRTVLTGGAIAAVVFSASSLFTADRHAFAALAYAGPVIIGSVLIAGGVFLLHRKDAHEFFTR